MDFAARLDDRRNLDAKPLSWIQSEHRWLPHRCTWTRRRQRWDRCPGCWYLVIRRGRRFLYMPAPRAWSFINCSKMFNPSETYIYTWIHSRLSHGLWLIEAWQAAYRNYMVRLIDGPMVSCIMLTLMHFDQWWSGFLSRQAIQHGHAIRMVAIPTIGSKTTKILKLRIKKRMSQGTLLPPRPTPNPSRQKKEPPRKKRKKYVSWHRDAQIYPKNARNQILFVTQVRPPK